MLILVPVLAYIVSSVFTSDDWEKFFAVAITFVVFCVFAEMIDPSLMTMDLTPLEQLWRKIQNV